MFLMKFCWTVIVGIPSLRGGDGVEISKISQKGGGTSDYFHKNEWLVKQEGLF